MLDTALKNWQKKYENIGCVTSSYMPKYEILVHCRLGCLVDDVIEYYHHSPTIAHMSLEQRTLKRIVELGNAFQKAVKELKNKGCTNKRIILLEDDAEGCI